MRAFDFASTFESLTGQPPFPWLEALYERFLSDRADNIPPSCNIPTGLGKTSVVAVWLIALANNPAKMPRRLVYVVNRRTVVDQTTDEVEKLRRNLGSAGLDEALRRLCALPANDEPPLAISTLRGQFADNREWSADPARPAVIAGTVDMIGSRLLFSGYGVGFKGKPLHAGFLGQDVLLVHDEAHLEPAFQELLIAIEREQHHGERTGTFSWRKIRVMELSATTRSEGETHKLGEMDYSHAEVKKRIEAKKTIYLIENRDEKKLAEEIADVALKFDDSKGAVLVFLRRVEDVERIVKKLPKGKTRQLTGTIRGLERDRLAKVDPIFARFLPASNRSADVVPVEGTVYLVCTSAGEVGVNISADHMVCDLSTFDSMAQRFGRVNRFGDRDDTEICVVYPRSLPSEKYMAAEKEKEKAKQDELIFVDGARRRTLELLQIGRGDGSPKALGDLDPIARLGAFSPPPRILPLSDILFDAWALTSIRGKLPGRPAVAPYLHGIAGWEPPETFVAWREEVGIITGELLATYDPKDLLEDYPLKPHELLRDNSNRVYDRLTKLTAPPETPVWIIAEDDLVQITKLGDLIDSDKAELNYKTVLLSPSAGGLENGMLTSNSEFANDVADDWFNEKGEPRRCRSVWDDDDPPDGMRLIRTIDINPEADEGDGKSPAPRFWKWFELPKGGDSDGSKANKKPVLLQVHTDDVTRNAEAFVKNLPLSDDMKNAVILAARFHDLGKRRKVFQRILGNSNPKVLLAKSGKKGSRIQEQYRHEFGSLLDVESEKDFQNLDGDIKEFVLHLIAVHHGRGRPHFPADEAFDPEPKGKNVSMIAAKVPQRFARLQRKYGRWGLAYLESLLRAADYAASANPSAFMEENS